MCRRIDLRVLVNLAFLQLSPLKCASNLFAVVLLPWLVSPAGFEVSENRDGSAFSAQFSYYGEFT